MPANSHNMAANERHTLSRHYIRYGRGFIAAGVLFAIVNILDCSRRTYSADFIYRYGLPFRFFESGGFAGMHRILWLGFAADLISFVLVAAIIGWTWVRLSVK